MQSCKDITLPLQSNKSLGILQKWQSGRPSGAVVVPPHIGLPALWMGAKRNQCGYWDRFGGQTFSAPKTNACVSSWIWVWVSLNGQFEVSTWSDCWLSSVAQWHEMQRSDWDTCFYFFQCVLIGIGWQWHRHIFWFCIRYLFTLILLEAIKKHFQLSIQMAFDKRFWKMESGDKKYIKLEKKIILIIH